MNFLAHLDIARWSDQVLVLSSNNFFVHSVKVKVCYSVIYTYVWIINPLYIIFLIRLI